MHPSAQGVDGGDFLPLQHVMPADMQAGRAARVCSEVQDLGKAPGQLEQGNRRCCNWDMLGELGQSQPSLQQLLCNKASRHKDLKGAGQWQVG